MTPPHRIAFVAVLAATLVNDTIAARSPGAPSWQLKNLHSPSPALLAAEAKGRVTIFEGLHVREVERAMREQFDRIEHLMFVNTRDDSPEGGGNGLDDGC